MDTNKLLAKAEAWKRKSHRLSVILRLKTISEAKKFIREQRLVLWKTKAELPNLLDANLGRIANGKERFHSKPAENCNAWRKELLKEPDVIECRFFRKNLTAVHQDLWSALLFFSKKNRQRIEEEDLVSRDARKVVSFLEKEGPTPADILRKQLKLNAGRSFSKICEELESLLLIKTRDEGRGLYLDLWANQIPKAIRSRTENTYEKQAAIELLSATLNGCVFGMEKDLPSWFSWSNGEMTGFMDELLKGKEFLRIEQKRKNWIIPRKVLSLRL